MNKHREEEESATTKKMPSTRQTSPETPTSQLVNFFKQARTLTWRIGRADRQTVHHIDAISLQTIATNCACLPTLPTSSTTEKEKEDWLFWSRDAHPPIQAKLSYFINP